MRNPLAPLLGFFRRLAVNREGNALILFAMAAIPVIIGAGIAIDTARAYMVKTRLGSALDAAALAVGSQPYGTDATTLQTALNNFFYDNYCKLVPGGTSVSSCQKEIAKETSISAQATSAIGGATVTYTATATVPTTFMRLVGVNNLSVTVKSQTTKFPGMEIAVVLDNTGSMLCGPSDGAPNYSDSLCAQNVQSSDTSCTQAPSPNQSRICTLIYAAKQFVTTLQGAVTTPGSVYMSIVPYVTTVNVGSNFCSNATTCNNITTDSCSGDFTMETTVNGQPQIIYNPSLGTAATVTGTVVNLTGTTASASKTVSSLSTTTGLAVGMAITDGSGKIPAGTTITAINGGLSRLTLSKAATGAKTGDSLRASTGGAVTTSNSPTVTFLSAPSASLTKGMIVTGSGIPANTAIKTVTGSGVSTVLTLCNNATATASNVSLSFYNPVTFDSTFNSTGATTKEWGGCVIEPTSSDENSGVSGVINSANSDPDVSEPASGSSWYPLYWQSANTSWPSGYTNWWSGGPNWTTPSAQNTSTETQGTVVGTYDQLPGPNAGCPVPILPLTDMTTSAGRTTIDNAIGAMWPKDSAGTQVAIGMTWGWRVLSSNGPFTSNNGHPLSYSDANNQGWKKIIVLMTDGTEEWPMSYDYTGLGSLSEGKAHTTSSTTTAQTNLDSRLQSVCNNIKASSGNFIIYTIGLGSDGASNTTLQNCASQSSYFYSATPSNLTTVFTDIANSIIHLRLTQ